MQVGTSLTPFPSPPLPARNLPCSQAAHYGNQVMVAHEDDQFQVVEQWEAVTEVDVQTPLEVYQELLGGLGGLQGEGL